MQRLSERKFRSSRWFNLNEIILFFDAGPFFCSYSKRTIKKPVETSITTTNWLANTSKLNPLDAVWDSEKDIKISQFLNRGDIRQTEISR